MAFFKFRKAGAEPQAARDPAESIEAMRRRARHRLIGAGVLVLVGVIGFPLLFDTQPRPIAVDIPIEIPDRNKARPLPSPTQSAPLAQSASTASAAPPPAAVVATPAPATAQVVAAAPVEAPSPKVEAAPVETSPPRAEAKPETKTVAKAEPKAEARPEPRSEPARPAARADDGSKAQALLEGKTAEHSSPAAEGRFVVQVGAFADASKAREARMKVEKAGLKTYTNVAETKDGKRIRVRAGPFGTRAEAQKAAERIKGLELPAAILTL
jgi:DedD protein